MMVDHACNRIDHVSLRSGGAEDVDHLVTAAGELVRNKISVTSPRHCFGAHDRRRHVRGEQAIERVLKFVGRHVIGITAELTVSPRGVGRIGKRIATASELDDVLIFDSRFRKRIRQRFAREMGIASRARKSSDVGEPFHDVVAKQTDQFVKRPRRMTDRVNAHAQCTKQDMARQLERRIEELETGDIAFYFDKRLMMSLGSRAIVIGRRRCTKRFWALIVDSPIEGERLGEGTYRIFRHSGHSHLEYELDGAVPEFNIRRRGSLIVTVMNPDPTVWEGEPHPFQEDLFDLDRRISTPFPASLQQRFRDRRYAQLETTEFLDFPGAELVLIAE